MKSGEEDEEEVESELIGRVRFLAGAAFAGRSASLSMSGLHRHVCADEDEPEPEPESESESEPSGGDRPGRLGIRVSRLP